MTSELWPLFFALPAGSNNSHLQCFHFWGYSDSKCTTKHNASPVIGLCVDVTYRLPGSLQSFLSEYEWQRRWQWSLVASLKPGVGLSDFLLLRCHFKRGWGLIYKLHTGCKTKTTVQWRDLCLSLRAFLDVMQQESIDVYWKDNGVLVGYFTL